MTATEASSRMPEETPFGNCQISNPETFSRIQIAREPTIPGDQNQDSYSISVNAQPRSENTVGTVGPMVEERGCSLASSKEFLGVEPSFHQALHPPPPPPPLPILPPSPHSPLPSWCDFHDVKRGDAKPKSSAARRAGFMLHIKSQTWAADSHGLFDYETRNVLTKVFRCNCLRDAYHLVRVGSDVHFFPADKAEAFYAQETEARLLVQMVWSNGYYTLIPNTYANVQGNCRRGARRNGSGNTVSDRLWLVVRNLREKGSAVIVQGDILKLGRYRLKVKEAVNTLQEDKSGRFLSTDYDDDDDDDDDNEDDCDTVAPESVAFPGGVSHPHDLGFPEDPTNNHAALCSFAAHQRISNVSDIPCAGSSSSGHQSHGCTPRFSETGAEADFCNLPSLIDNPTVATLLDPFLSSGPPMTTVNHEHSSDRASVFASSLKNSVTVHSRGADLCPSSPQAVTTEISTYDPHGPSQGHGPVLSKSGDVLASNTVGSVPSDASLRPCLEPSFSPALKRGKSYCGPRTCRICLCEAEEGSDSKDVNGNSNPLVAPCQCRGSMKWVHLMCLRTWMAGRLNIRNDGSTICFFWRSLECELCKLPYPSVVKVCDEADFYNNLDSTSQTESTRDTQRARSDFSRTLSRMTKVDLQPVLEEKSVEWSTESACSSKPLSFNQTRRSLNCSKTDFPLRPHADASSSSSSSSSNPLNLSTAAVSSSASGGKQKKDSSAKLCRTVELFEIPRPEIPYAILEPRSLQGRGLHIVSLARNKAARLGRGHESDIRLPDISVSRLHSVLRYQIGLPKKSLLVGSTGMYPCAPPNGYFVIDDNKSKFGTLLEIRKPFRLDLNTYPLSVQIGRTVLTFTFKRRWRLLFPTCIWHPASDISVVLHHHHQQHRSRQSHSQDPHSHHLISSHDEQNLQDEEAVSRPVQVENLHDNHGGLGQISPVPPTEPNPTTFMRPVAVSIRQSSSRLLDVATLPRDPGNAIQISRYPAVAHIQSRSGEVSPLSERDSFEHLPLAEHHVSEINHEVSTARFVPQGP